MDETLIWCALIGAVAYVTRGAFPSYYELTKAKHGRIDAINDQVDDNEQTMLAMGKKIEDMQSDIAGHLTRLDDIDGRAVVDVRAVNYANSSNIVYRHTVQVRINGGEWADIPVNTVWGSDEEAAMYIIASQRDEEDEP